MKKPIPPQRLKDAFAKIGKYDPNRLDSDVKKLYNKWSRERKKWDKWDGERRREKFRKEAEEWQKRAEERKEKEYENSEYRISRCIEEESYSEATLDHLIYEQENTTDWNVNYTCKYDDCKSCSMRIVLTPKLKHFAKYVCNLCDRYNDWIPYPEEYGDPE